MSYQKIDPHVHFRDEEQAYKETIAHGLTLAQEQGVAYVFDMPNTFRPILTAEDVERRLKCVPAKDAGRYFLYVGATTDPRQIKEAVQLVGAKKEVIGIKCFAGKSTGNLAVEQEDAQKLIYKTLTQYDYRGILAVHCEKEAYMTEAFTPQKPISHAWARPNIAEIESIKDQIRFVKETGFKGGLVICHVSCKASVALICEAKTHMKIYGGVTPHHILWDETKLNGEHGLLYKTNPPLRSKDDVEGLKGYLIQGKIDWVETDHAPHTIGEKFFNGFPSGYPSLYLYKTFMEGYLPQLGITPRQIQDLSSRNIQAAYRFSG